jgi:hypothetical protein
MAENFPAARFFLKFFGSLDQYSGHSYQYIQAGPPGLLKSSGYPLLKIQAGLVLQRQYRAQVNVVQASGSQYPGKMRLRRHTKKHPVSFSC